MAKFRPTLGELSGSIGNATWTRGKAGPVLRRRTAPTNRNTTQQQGMRTRLSTLARRWATFTPTQKTEWNQYAQLNPRTDALGQPKILSGAQMFTGLNLAFGRSAVSSTIITTPPTVSMPPIPTVTSITLHAAGTMVVAFTPSPTNTNLRWQIYVSRPHTAGVHPTFRASYQNNNIPSGTATPATVTNSFPFLAGQVVTVWFFGADKRTGLTAPPARFDVTVVA